VLRCGGGWTSPSLTDKLESLSKIEQRPVDRISKTRPPEERSKPTAANDRRRTWFRIVALGVIPLALLFGIEGVLRVAGCGYSACFFRTRPLQGQVVWTGNPDFGRRFFSPGLTRYAHPFIIPQLKSPNALRVFVFGESAAMGDPDFKFGLPRMLEVLLRERFPERRIEVINAAMVAINSHVVLPIARDSVGHGADLWVVYMGNNEMIGPFGSASIFGARAPALPAVRANLWLKETRVGQLLDSGIYWLRRRGQPLPTWRGMEMMVEQKIRPHSSENERVYKNFSRNLSELLETASTEGVPVILCTVASNLKDCAPFASLHRPGLTALQLSDWQSAYDKGCALQKVGSSAEAKAAYEHAARIDPDFAEVWFRLAECSRLLGQGS